MLPLAVLGGEATLWQALAPRLRGARFHESGRQEASTAVVSLNADADDALLEKAWSAGQHILFAANSAWPAKWIDRQRVMIANPLRYLPSRQLIRQQLETGKLGEPG